MKSKSRHPLEYLFCLLIIALFYLLSAPALNIAMRAHIARLGLPDPTDAFNTATPPSWVQAIHTYNQPLRWLTDQHPPVRQRVQDYEHWLTTQFIPRLQQR